MKGLVPSRLRPIASPVVCRYVKQWERRVAASGERISAALRWVVRERRRGMIWTIPIIVLSADAYSSVRHRLLAIGVAAYVTKPFKVAEMLETIERLLTENSDSRAPAAALLPKQQPHRNAADECAESTAVHLAASGQGRGNSFR